MIFTVPSAVLWEEYPLFSKWPQKHASFGTERGGICHDFNTTSTCKRNETRVDSAIFVSSAMAHTQDISVQSLKGCERTKSIHPTTNAISIELSANVLTYLTPTPIVYSHLTRRHTSWAPRHAVRATIMRQFKIWGLNWIWGRANPYIFKTFAYCRCPYKHCHFKFGKRDLPWPRGLSIRYPTVY